LLVAVWGSWLTREQADVIAFLREENRILKARLAGQRLRFDDRERRRLAEVGHPLGRRLLTRVATIVTPDTILRWHRELVARKWTYRARRGRSPGLHTHLRALVIRMATENPTWGYTRIQGALKNLGHCVGRSTIARILRAEGFPPGRQRPVTWRTFAERFVRSVKEEGLNRVVPLGERHLRQTLHAFVTHYHCERNHQGLATELIDGHQAQQRMGAIRCRQRVGGILSYYYRSAA
jgi:putative transposase